MFAPDPPARAGPTDLGCRQSMAVLADLRDGLSIPPYFSHENPVKRGGEFDPNRYFEAFPTLSMRSGYTLDWVYRQDGIGGYPILYARPVSQRPYADEKDYRAAGEHPNYLQFVEVQDSPRGFFDYAVLAMTANQFYQDWHARYNDWQVVCDGPGIEAIIDALTTGNPSARPMTAAQQRAARAIADPSPTVTLDDRTATVSMLVFTKWGGFYRRTLTIDRNTHSILDEQDRPLVDYDCGIAF
ncbi:MAG: hypothetical protein KDB47_11690 [Mycobacterium sp.]|nr:hypothetical protein [Mycobacterium sp.]